MRNTTFVAVAVIALATLTTWANPPAAEACGGFFCNNQQIEQAGERILYSYEQDGTIVTVVSIQYAGPSEEFAWILPIPAEPTVSVGTDALFRALDGATTPRFQLEYQIQGACRAEPACYYYRYTEADSLNTVGGPPAADAGAAVPDVDVRFVGAVGPYAVAVLAAGDATALRTWLTDNGYLIPASASAELDHYVALNHFFVALKLQKDRSAGEIQPIVLRSANTEPCIPIRLTRIATVPDMPITAYFLADQRVRPFNYQLLSPDLDNSGLWLGTTSYASVVTNAVNEAGGHAFVTDYAGEMPVLDITIDAIEDLRTIDDPAAFLNQLQSRGFTGDSQLLGILMRFLPPPPDYDAQTFYNCLVQGWCDSTVQAYVASLAFDPSGLVDALNTAIIEPRAEGQRMLDAHARMTRLFTTMSAEDMTVDPMFEQTPLLPFNVTNVHGAVLRTDCDSQYFYWTAPQTIILPSGRTELVREGVPYYGTDEELCEDMSRGFYPGASTDLLREVAATRTLRPGGGGLCSIAPGASGLGGALLLALFGVWLWRRRNQ